MQSASAASSIWYVKYGFPHVFHIFKSSYFYEAFSATRFAGGVYILSVYPLKYIWLYLEHTSFLGASNSSSRILLFVLNSAAT